MIWLLVPELRRDLMNIGVRSEVRQQAQHNNLDSPLHKTGACVNMC